MNRLIPVLTLLWAGTVFAGPDLQPASNSAWISELSRDHGECLLNHPLPSGTPEQEAVHMARACAPIATLLCFEQAQAAQESGNRGLEFRDRMEAACVRSLTRPDRYSRLVDKIRAYREERS